MPTAASPSSLSLPGYVGLPGRYDEAVAPDGSLRPAWAQFLGTLGRDPYAALRAAGDHARRAIVEQDVSLNIYSGEGSAAAAWPLDVVPALLDSSAWDFISKGLRQRAHLFNALLKDLYGPQRYLRSGVLPAALAMANPHYLRACAELGKGRSPFVHLYAADIARSPDGRWWVIQDRLDSPSGLGYALQNRLIVREALAGAFSDTPVRRLYQFSRDLRASLDHLHPRAESPRIALLSPGPANESYFEHSYLARHLGCSLVEGGDLLVRDRQVFLRTVGGLRKVDVLLRRIDSDFCDPLELDPRSLLGVPGLVDAAHSGRVAVSNQLGGRALETTALLAFLAPLARQVLNEALHIPNAATWWGGQVAARDYILANLDTLVIKPTFGGQPPRYGALLTSSQRASLAAEIRARPAAWCGQERVLLGTTPVWNPAADALRAAPFVTRVYLVWHEGEYQVMPGGLTRFNPSGEDGIVTLQGGSVSKDTWVLAPESQSDNPKINLASSPASAPRHGAATPSRLADTLFWLGRYLERTGQLSRLLEKLDPLRRDEITTLDPSVARDAARLVLELQDQYSPANASLDDLVTLARRVASDRRHPGGLVANLLRLSRNLEIAKVRLPPEAWQIARQLRPLGAEGSSPTPATIRAHLITLDGLVSDTLIHDTGWRFLDLGRRLERANHLLLLLRGLLGRAPAAGSGEFRFHTCLHLADSLFTYRANFYGTIHPGGVLAWLLAEPENPRGLRFQAERIGEHLAALPDELSPRAVEQLRTTAFRLLSAARLVQTDATEVTPASVTTFANTQLALLAELNARVAAIYFAHANGRKD